MALEQEMMQQAPEETNETTPDKEQGEGAGGSSDKLDLKIAVMLGERLLEDGGFDVIESAVKHSSDPGQVIGQFLMQMGQQMMESMPEDTKLSPAILLQPGGWVEQMSDYIQKQAHVKKEIMDKAEIYVASTAQQMAQAKRGQVDGVQAPVGTATGQAAAPAGPPAMPQGAM